MWLATTLNKFYGGFKKVAENKDAAWHEARFDRHVAKLREVAALTGPVPEEFQTLYRAVFFEDDPCERVNHLLTWHLMDQDKKRKRTDDEPDVIACLAHPIGALLVATLEALMEFRVMRTTWPTVEGTACAATVVRLRWLFELEEWLMQDDISTILNMFCVNGDEFGVNGDEYEFEKVEFATADLLHVLDVQLPAIRLVHVLGTRGDDALPEALAFLRGLSIPDRIAVRDTYFTDEQQHHELLCDGEWQAWPDAVRDAIRDFHAEDLVDRAVEHCFSVKAAAALVTGKQKHVLAALRAFAGSPRVPVPTELLSKVLTLAKDMHADALIGVASKTPHLAKEATSLEPWLESLVDALALARDLARAP